MLNISGFKFLLLQFQDQQDLGVFYRFWNFNDKFTPSNVMLADCDFKFRCIFLGDSQLFI